MKYIVVSDIHSNYHALSAVLNDAIESYGQDVKFVSLGDMFGIGAMPKQTLSTILDQFDEYIISYSDKVVLDKTVYSSLPPMEKETIDWTIEQFEDSDLLSKIKKQVFITKVAHEKVVGFAHSNFHDNRTPVETVQDAISNLGGSDVVFVGGTHVQMAYLLEGHEIKSLKPKTTLDEEVIKLGNARALINVGSVGSSRDGTTKASYVYFDTSADEVVFKKVKYAHDLHIAKMQNAHFNSELILRAMAGR